MDLGRAAGRSALRLTVGRISVLASLAAVVPAPTLAQPPDPPGAVARGPDRLVLGVGVGGQLQSFQRVDTFTYDLFAERSMFTASQEVGPDRVLDGGLSVRLVRWFGIGIATSYVEGRETATVRTDVPHPFFFDFDRATEGVAPGLRHEELAIHGQLQVWFPLGSSGRLTFALGPTYFDARQDIVTELTTAEVGFPFDEVEIAAHTTTGVARTALGYNVSLDLSYFGLRRLGLLSGVGALDHIGVGLLVRYSRATPEVSVGEVRQPALELGGVHVAGGVRIGF